MSSSHGRFVWYELMTTDLAAAETFYAGVMGWNVSDSGMPNMRYSFFKAGDVGVGGGMALPEGAAGMPPHWLGYIGVDDVDDYAARIVKAGGAVHHAAEDIPDTGRFAVVADPQGAVFALYKSAPGREAPEPDPWMPGLAGWRELMAADAPAVFGFYADLFGWAKGEAIDMGPMGIYQIITRNNAMMGGMMTKPPALPKPFWQFYFNTENIDAAQGRVVAGGGQVIHGPQQVPGGAWILQCLDPQGGLFALVGQRG